MIKYLLLIALLLAVSSCSPSWYLKQAIKHGAKVTVDTIYVDIPVPASSTAVHDTIEKKVFSDKIFRDTLILENNKWRTKTIYDTIHHTIYQEVLIKEDTLKNVPVLAKTTIEEPVQKLVWWKWLFVAIILILLLLLSLNVIKR